MRRYARRGKYTPTRDGGSFWLCYSDLMSSLLLVFVLVMFFSVYQYLDMLEIKTAELMQQSGLLDQKESELTEKNQALDIAQQKLTQSEKDIITQQAQLLLTQQEVESTQSLLTQQQSQLDAARILLGDQTAELDSARILLSQQTSALDDARVQLEFQQLTVAQQQTLLAQQQAQMVTQQEKLDALVGIRARIVASLADALSAANVRATVDAHTGSITLDASVLFDVARSDLKYSGQSVLDQFLPVYLSVLMAPENAGNIAEIIIEGHTDTDGSYMSNLQLSQERALSVMEYILSDDYSVISADAKQQLRKIATANGRSFSNPVYGPFGEVDKDASRRVEFKFRMHDEQMVDDMRKLLEHME